jgi:hypothetical protein
VDTAEEKRLGNGGLVAICYQIQLITTPRARPTARQARFRSERCCAWRLYATTRADACTSSRLLKSRVLHSINVVQNTHPPYTILSLHLSTISSLFEKEGILPCVIRLNHIRIRNHERSDDALEKSSCNDVILTMVLDLNANLTSPPGGFCH